MIKKLRSTISKCSSGVLLLLLAAVWQLVCSLELVPAFMLPSPIRVASAFTADFSLLMKAGATTLGEAFAGLSLGIAGGFVLAVLMDHSGFLYRALYPLLLLTQTIPTVAIAPLLVLWMGYGMAPKVTLVFLVCFFPITVGVLDGLRSADSDAITLLRSMGATQRQIAWHIKIPCALPRFFSGLKIAVTYSIVGAVIAEWLGGNGGLGVYMTRVRKSYSFDKMFAVIILVSVLSILLLQIVNFLQKKSMPYAYIKD